MARLVGDGYYDIAVRHFWTVSCCRHRLPDLCGREAEVRERLKRRGRMEGLVPFWFASLGSFVPALKLDLWRAERGRYIERIARLCSPGGSKTMV